MLCGYNKYINEKIGPSNNFLIFEELKKILLKKHNSLTTVEILEIQDIVKQEEYVNYRIFPISLDTIIELAPESDFY